MEEGSLVLCKVKEVSNTITSVELPDGKQGTIISSEIAPGRIKFMRQYVVPNKQIVCKILGISGDNVHLSLRRVNSKEKKEVMQIYKQEQAINVGFKQILGDNLEKVKDKILKDFETLGQFIKATREDKKLIEKYIPKTNQESIKKLTEKKKKSQELKQNIKIKCLEEDGVKKIKEIFDIKDENVSVNYISAGQFKLKLRVDDFKEGKKRIAEILEELEEKTKKYKCEFFTSEEK
jgi:translation initiation factor 2 alpha subunit (eIF-2alpha)